MGFKSLGEVEKIKIDTHLEWCSSLNTDIFAETFAAIGGFTIIAVSIQSLINEWMNEWMNEWINEWMNE